jgi:hypothetical protein
MAFLGMKQPEQENFSVNPLRELVNKLRGSQEPMHPLVEGGMDLLGEQESLLPMPPVANIGKLMSRLGDLPSMGNISNFKMGVPNNVRGESANIITDFADQSMDDIGRPSFMNRIQQFMGNEGDAPMMRNLLQNSHETLEGLPGFLKDRAKGWQSVDYNNRMDSDILGQYNWKYPSRTGKMDIATDNIRQGNNALYESHSTPIHEFGHALYSNLPDDELRRFQNEFWKEKVRDEMPIDQYLQIAGQMGDKMTPLGRPTKYGATNPMEDFAESFANTMFMENPNLNRMFPIQSREISAIDDIDNFKRRDYMYDLVQKIKGGR